MIARTPNGYGRYLVRFGNATHISPEPGLHFIFDQGLAVFGGEHTMKEQAGMGHGKGILVSRSWRD